MARNVRATTVPCGAPVYIKAHFPSGVGDFEGKGKAGILRRRDYGTVTISLLNRSSVTAEVSASQPSVGWSIIGIGNCYADERTDILWQSSDGSLKAEMMNGLPIASSATDSSITADCTAS